MSKIVRFMRRRQILEGLFTRRGRKYFCNSSNNNSNSGRYLRVLGIESSCDDTGAAVVDSNGAILGEALHSQTSFTVEMGGVMPYVAQQLHAAHIDGVVTEALRDAQMDVSEVDAIACTNRPRAPRVSPRRAQLRQEAGGKNRETSDTHPPHARACADCADDG